MYACISSYPGTNTGVLGEIQVDFDTNTNDITYKFKLDGLESNVIAGTHIHTGFTCDDASLVGGHHYNGIDPWFNSFGAVYRTNLFGNAIGEFTLNSGYGYDDNLGRAVVVHDSTGARVGCGVLKSSYTKCITKLAACINPYPGSKSKINGKVIVTHEKSTTDLTYTYGMRGVEKNVTAGTHIHSGMSCDDASLVGGHYWDKGADESNPDPWTDIYGAVYNTSPQGTALGNFHINSGYGFHENKGHAVVVHASDGSRIGCGILNTLGNTGRCPPRRKILETCISDYPGTTSGVSGKITVIIDIHDNDMEYRFKLKGLESSIIGGTHIHTGTTCNDAALVGGHYWNGQNPDPWTNANGAIYTSNAQGKALGSFKLNNGLSYDENNNHAVVVHAANGSRVGCGVLSEIRVNNCV